MFALFQTHRHAVKIKCINKLFPGYQKMLSMYIKHIDCNDPDKDLGVDKISFRSQCSPLFGVWKPLKSRILFPS